MISPAFPILLNPALMSINAFHTSVISLILFSIFSAGCSTGKSWSAQETLNIAREFEQRHVTGTFVLLDSQTAQMQCYNCARAHQRFLPASTFKIANALIALETGVVDDAGFTLPWNSEATPRQTWWPDTWAKDQTLKSAFAGSVVWYYQELARRIGHERMQSYVRRFRYGNEDISGGIDQFWLTGGTRISAVEQVDFLRRFHQNGLGASAHSTNVVKDILTLEHTPHYRLSGKTGWAGFGDSKPGLGWLVGYLERDGSVAFFAMNIDINENADAASRLAIVKSVLRDSRYIE